MTDLSKYRRHVEHLDLSEGEKTDLLTALWHIMESFVDRAIGEDSVQEVQRQATLAGGSAEGSRPAGRAARERASDREPVLDSLLTTKLQTTRLSGDFQESGHRGERK